MLSHSYPMQASTVYRSSLCVAGAIAFRVPDIVGLLSRIGNDNAKGEYYLTDAVALRNIRNRAGMAVVGMRGGQLAGIGQLEQLNQGGAVVDGGIHATKGK